MSFYVKYLKERIGVAECTLHLPPKAIAIDFNAFPSVILAFVAFRIVEGYGMVDRLVRTTVNGK